MACWGILLQSHQLCGIPPRQLSVPKAIFFNYFNLQQNPKRSYLKVFVKEASKEQL